MGGFGSGRKEVGKLTTSDMRTLDIRALQASGRVAAGQHFSWEWSRKGKKEASIHIDTEIDRVILKYQRANKSGDGQTLEHPVRLEWTTCHFGGQRAWFLCPAQGCGRRVAILFDGSILACRHCHKLAYECQRETDELRAMRRADTIRRRLGWGAGIARPEGGKPKGMHWSTYRHLKAEYAAFANTSWAEIAQRMANIQRGLKRISDKMKLDV